MSEGKWIIDHSYDGPDGIHVSFERFISATGSLVTPWIKVSRDMGMDRGVIWFSQREWEWVVSNMSAYEVPDDRPS